MSTSERDRRNGRGTDDTGIVLLRESIERVATSLPEVPRGTASAPHAARGATLRTLAAALVVLAVAVGAWLALSRIPSNGISAGVVAESELKVEIFRVRGRAVPATVLAPSGAGSVLVIPKVEAREVPPAPQGIVGTGGGR